MKDGMPLLADNLVRSAALAHEWSRTMCKGCADYHGTWQYLRLLGFATTPHDHAPFYRAALRPLARNRMQRVLIAGCADQAMLETAASAFAGEATRPDLTVVDMCETPIALCRWHAAQAGLTIKTERADLFSYSSAKPFEIICTHVLFAQVAPADRPPLIAHWRTLLEPGGRVVMVSRLRPETTGAVARNAADVKRFGAQVRHAAEASPVPGAPAPAELERRAEAFFAAAPSYPVRSVEELSTLFEGAGFGVDVSLVQHATAPTPNVMQRGGLYAQIVAIRS